MKSGPIDKKLLSSYYPGDGAIFMANQWTRDECFERKLFGLPRSSSDFVFKVKKGMYLFLFDYHSRSLYGVFEAISDGGLDLEPDAFKSTKMRFPAQVRFDVLWECHPLPEKVFCDAIEENYIAPNKFNCGLSSDQVHNLLFLFKKAKVHIQRFPQMAQRHTKNASSTKLASMVAYKPNMRSDLNDYSSRSRLPRKNGRRKRKQLLVPALSQRTSLPCKTESAICEDESDKKLDPIHHETSSNEDRDPETSSDEDPDPVEKLLADYQAYLFRTRLEDCTIGVGEEGPHEYHSVQDHDYYVPTTGG